MSVCEQANGKFILLGEHFVVHSQVPAIALPLRTLWCSVELTKSNNSKYIAEYSGIAKTNENPDQIYLLMEKALEKVLIQLNLNTKLSYKIVSKANFPISRGFGSSAAFAIALTKAVISFHGINTMPKNNYKNLLLNTSYEVEKIFHGNASGVDTCVIIEESPIVFERIDHKNYTYKTIENLCVDFLLIDSGPRESSSVLIDRISSTRNNSPSRWSSYVTKMKSNSLRCAEYLGISGSRAADNVFQSINETNEILSELGLSSFNINHNIKIAFETGAQACKPSGAGTGGATLITTYAGDGLKLKQKLLAKNIPILAQSFAYESVKA